MISCKLFSTKSSIILLHVSVDCKFIVLNISIQDTLSLILCITYLEYASFSLNILLLSASIRFFSSLIISVKSTDSNNELSVWKADTQEDIEDAIVALALNRDRVSKLSYFLLEEDEVELGGGNIVDVNITAQAGFWVKATTGALTFTYKK